MTRVSYERVPFPGRPVPWASPAALALTSFVHGGPWLDPNAPLRVLGLGCGDGAHLVPLAFFHPGSRFVGVDTSPGALRVARDAKEEVGLDNLELVEADLAAFEADAPFDVIVAHGLYSWVDREHRGALRRLIGGALADGGLSFVSWNALPGWAIRGRVRDALVRSPADGLSGARTRLAQLRALLPDEPDDLWTSFLSHELERALAAPDGYLAHEYLAPDNEAFWLGDVVRDFEREGLTYLGDATFDRLEGFVEPGVRERAEAITDDRIASEEHIDLRTFRQLHAAVFARRRAAAPRPEAAVERAWIASCARRERDPFDLDPRVEERFEGALGRQIRTCSPTLKMALLLLADRYPAACAFDALHAECASRLGGYGLEVEERAWLASSLARLHRELQVELRLANPPLLRAPGDRPLATALTRWEARHRYALTTPLHTMLPLEPIDRAIVGLLDGARTRVEIVGALVSAIADGSLELEGAPSGAARLTPLVESSLDAQIATLAMWGLCA